MRHIHWPTGYHLLPRALYLGAGVYIPEGMLFHHQYDTAAPSRVQLRPTFVDEVCMPSKLAASVRYPVASILVKFAAFLTSFPYEGDTSTNTGYLCSLRVSFNLSMSEVQTDPLLILRRQVLVTEDCDRISHGLA